MYSEWYKEQLEAVLNYATYYNLDSRSVYNLLASYGVDEGTKGMDQTNLKNRCAAYAAQREWSRWNRHPGCRRC